MQCCKNNRDKLIIISLRKKLIKFIKNGDNYLEKDIIVEVEKLKKDEKRLMDEKDHYEDIKKKEEFEKRKISEIEKVTNLFVDKIDNADFGLKKKVINIMIEKIVVYPFDKSKDKRIVEIYYNFNKKDVVIIKSSLTAL